MYKAKRHGVTEVAVKMVKCVVRQLPETPRKVDRICLFRLAVVPNAQVSVFPSPHVSRSLADEQAEDASTLQLMRKEIGIMQRISYDPHIVQFFGACTTVEPAMLVMEYMRVRATTPARDFCY